MRVNITDNEIVKLKNAIAANSQLRGLLTSSYAQVDNYVDTNLTTLAAIRTAIKMILKICLFLLKTKMKEWNI